MQPLGRRRLIGLLVLAGFWLASGGRLHAQITSTIPSFMLPQQEAAAPGTNFNSAVSWMDSAYPQSQVRIRGDFLYDSIQPQRAEYIWAQGGSPGTPGPPKLETKLDTQEVETYLELALGGVFSIFLESPYVWMNPSVNPNSNGVGDTNAGFKWMFLPGQDLQLSLQLRAYFPTGLQAELGTHHYTLEPALLGHYNLLGLLQIEGELRYWAPIGGTDFSGDIIRYGLGLSYGQRSASDIWLMPVVEVHRLDGAVGRDVRGDRPEPVRGPERRWGHHRQRLRGPSARPGQPVRFLRGLWPGIDGRSMVSRQFPPGVSVPVLTHQLQHAPQTGIFPERKLRADAEHLLAEFLVAHAVIEAEARMLFRIVAVQHAYRQKRFEHVAVLSRSEQIRHGVGRSRRCIGEGAVDLGLHHARLIVIGTAAGRQEMKLMAITAGAMAGPGIARVQPEGEAVGAARPGDVADRRILLAGDFHLHPQAQFVPGQVDFREILRIFGSGKVVDSMLRGKFEQAILRRTRHGTQIPARMSDSAQEALRDERHALIVWGAFFMASGERKRPDKRRRAHSGRLCSGLAKVAVRMRSGRMSIISPEANQTDQAQVGSPAWPTKR